MMSIILSGEQVAHLLDVLDTAEDALQWYKEGREASGQVAAVADSALWHVRKTIDELKQLATPEHTAPLQ